MTEPRFISESNYDSCNPATLVERELLERAVAKVILLGEQVGVNTDQMILLLKSGLTVRELLEYLIMRAGNSA